MNKDIIRHGLYRLKILLGREFLEHKLSCFWLYINTAAIMLGLALYCAGHLWFSGIGTIEIDGARFAFEEIGIADKISSTATSLSLKLLTGISIIFTFLWVANAGFYLISSLFEDRKDRSILFWKSLPVSETENVVVKLFNAIFILPIWAYICSIVAHSLSLLITVAALSAYLDINLWASLNMGDIAHQYQENFGMIVRLGLWISPIAAYLLVISAFAKKNPAAMAIVPIVSIMFIEKLFLGQSYLLQGLQWLLPSDSNISLALPLLSIELVGSLLLTTLFTALAIWLRNNRFEL